MLSTLFDKVAAIERLSAGVKKTYQTLSTIPCHLQPISGDTTGDIQGGYGKDWLMISGESDIREGDRATIDGKAYRVTSTELLSFAGHSHRETTLRAFEA